MKRYGLLLILLSLFLVACGESVSIHDLWEDYQEEVFVMIDTYDYSEILEKDLKDLNRYVFFYLDEENNFHEITSFAKKGNDRFVSTEDGLELAKEKVVPLEEFFVPIPKTQFFMKKSADDSYDNIGPLFWFDEEQTSIQSLSLYKALDEEVNLETRTLKELSEIIQDKENEILEKDVSDIYHQLEDASFKLIQHDFVEDLQLQEKLGFNKDFEFREMKIRFTGIDTWSKVDNQFSDYDGKDVFLLSVELENISDEKNKLNMFTYKAFDPEGKELPGVSAYFDNTLAHHDELLAGGKTQALYPILYRGDGEYQIHFEDYDGDQIIYLEIKK